MDNPYIFISYAHKDSNLAYGEFSFDKFINDLLDNNFNLWVDSEALQIGTAWDSEIKKGIDKCDAFFLIVTENSAKSDYTRDKEVLYAQRKGITVIPIIVEESAMKAFNNVDVKQGIKFDGDYHSSFQKLVEHFKHLKSLTAYRSVIDMLGDPAVQTVEDAMQHVRVSLPFPRHRDVKGLLIDRSPNRLTAYLVAPLKKELVYHDRLQIFLQFSGETNQKTFDEYLDYVNASPHDLWTLLIRGSYDKEQKGDWEYVLDNENEDVWREAVSFILKNVRAMKGDNDFDIYLNTPNALTLILAHQFSELKNGRFTVYNYNRGAKDKSQRYMPVYSNRD